MVRPSALAVLRYSGGEPCDAFEQESAPALMVLGRPDRGDDREHAVEHGVDREQQNEGAKRNPWEQKGREPKQDTEDSAQSERPPVPNQHLCHRSSSQPDVMIQSATVIRSLDPPAAAATAGW